MLIFRGKPKAFVSTILKQFIKFSFLESNDFLEKLSLYYEVVGRCAPFWIAVFAAMTRGHLGVFFAGRETRWLFCVKREMNDMWLGNVIPRRIWYGDIPRVLRASQWRGRASRDRRK